MTQVNAAIADAFDPTSVIDLAGLEFRTLVFVERSQSIVSKSEGTGLFKVFFKFGAKWARLHDTDSEPTPAALETKLGPEQNDVITIECGIAAEFALAKRYKQTELDDFALTRAVGFVVPYWRNFLIAQCAMMRLQGLAILDGNLTSESNNGNL
ncbi:hypothetical protein [Pseudomonas sp. PvP001]|uniref:hypothetical protein n=1 Tax=Pseudomonas sp. PvP001 TaxID=3158559 RepID=UPI003395825C